MTTSAMADLGLTTHALDIGYSRKLNLNSAFGFICAVASASGMQKHGAAVVSTVSEHASASLRYEDWYDMGWYGWLLPVQAGHSCPLPEFKLYTCADGWTSWYAFLAASHAGVEDLRSVVDSGSEVPWLVWGLSRILANRSRA